ncbi:DUF6160 family protein [Mangrovitalea sediminis]|uniref:DUF6160 family protein n=1 Tax=Mangrovitalea sediminis TaxID=1982043 RepID=UPI000BE4C13D|nr:DUF6160 family protein [Mangrovitalea sediminis]
MKGLKKLVLVTAIAAAPMVANAQLKALNDSTLGNVTGQAGVTIELSSHMTIGQIKYTDDGSLTINNVEVGGAGVTANGAAYATANNTGWTNALDDAAILIDIAANGDATIDLGSISGNPIDWGVKVGSIGIQDSTGATSTTLLSNMEAFGLLGALNITVHNQDYTPFGATAATSSLELQTAFSVEDMQFDANFVAVGIRGLSIHHGGYLAAVAAGNTAGATAAQFATADLNLYASTPTATSVTLLGSTGPVQVAQTATSALAIDVAVSPMDINMSQVLVGGVSVGSVAISNLAVDNTTLRIYGH